MAPDLDAVLELVEPAVELVFIPASLPSRESFQAESLSGFLPTRKAKRIRKPAWLIVAMRVLFFYINPLSL
jgi:hypothetical protein